MMLVLHGKEDKVLPPSQATAFGQACAGYGFRERLRWQSAPARPYFRREGTFD